MKTIYFILIFAVASFSAFSSDTDTAKAPQMKSVLVTGTSTGIGRNLAETLAQNGHHVYAGVRKDKDFTALNAIDNITAVRLDVTSQEDVDAVVALIEKSGTGLYALVNNAGIGNFGNVIEADLADHEATYKVNVEGVYRVTKAFAPMIIASKGRISTTGSIAGTVTGQSMSAYSGSKHWIEAFTDGLAAEMAEHGVQVSVIEPGNYQSHIRRSSVLRSFAKAEAAGQAITPEMQKRFEDTSKRELSYKQPDDVSAAFMHALFNDQAHRRYVVTPNQQEQAYTIGSKVRELAQLNQWGPHSYTRDQLVDMLDKALKDLSAKD
jgi:NAD(P)-dependent dehydrogenase (short-subunit alcohol dehydrogenase family)